MSTTSAPRIGVMGAGAIGSYVGACLLADGFDVALVGRPSGRDEVREHGLRITDYTGREHKLSAAQVSFSTDASGVKGTRFVLVTVKGLATESAGKEMAPHLDPDAVVVSLQNGVQNPDVLRRTLGSRRVLAAMVPFNVVRQGPGRYHRGTSGALVIEATPDGVEAPLVEALNRSGVETVALKNVLEVQWGKLLLNLNNALNALAGVPLLEQISDRAYRLVLAASMSEALSLLRAARIRPETNVALPASAVPWLLRMPTPVFSRVASKLMAIDPQARSSMWEDLERRRRTEIDLLNGEIVALARRLGRRAPVNERIVQLVGDAERAGAGSPRMSADALAREVRYAR